MPGQSFNTGDTPPEGVSSIAFRRGMGALDNPDEAKAFPVSGVRSDSLGWAHRPPSGLQPHGVQVPDRVRIPTMRIRNQGITNSCVGFGFSRHINARLAFLAGASPDNCPVPSALGIYGLARENDMNEDKSFKNDKGCVPFYAAQQMMRHGVIDESRFPFGATDDSAQALQPLQWDQLTAGFDAKVLRFNQMVDARGREEEFLDELERLIASGYTVAFSQQVDDAFQQYDGGKDLGPVEGPTYGRHYTVLKEYDRPRRIAVGDNSWGEDWGVKGEYGISYDRLVTPACRDFVVLTSIPDPRNIR